MIRRLLSAVVLTAGLCAGQSEWATAKLPDVEIQARVIRDVDRIQELLGDKLDEDFILVEIKARPLYGTKLELDRDSFLLRSFNGNDTSTAQSPDRIAGSSVLTLGQEQRGGGSIFSQDPNGIPVGGLPGTGTRPQRIETTPTTIGSGGGGETETKIGLEKVENETLVGRLQRLELPLAPGDRDVEGYLYFQVSPKHKLKHLSLSYDGKYGEFKLTFDK